jgi:hypothetical protein
MCFLCPGLYGRPTPLLHSTLTIGAAARNPNFRGSWCTLTGRGSRTHPNWRRGNSHSASAGRLVYNICGVWRRRWGGGLVTRRLQARFWSRVQIPKIANFLFFFDGRRTEIGWQITASKLRSLNTSVRYLTFHQEDSVCNPQTLVLLKSWRPQLSLCAIS